MTISLDLGVFGGISDDQFFDFCQRHHGLRIERSARGEVQIMPPAGGETGHRNFKLNGRFFLWAQNNDQLGLAFDSSTGFRLPTGTIRAPDLAWVRRDRWEALEGEEKRKFPPLCPDFVVELLSSPEDLLDTRLKMQEYLDNGLRLGWLLDPFARRAEVYRAASPVEVHEKPLSLSGERLLPGLDLDLSGILS